MRISTVTLTGKHIALHVEPYDTILEIKEKICDKEGIPTSSQRIVFTGKLLDDYKTVRDYNIPNGGTFNLVLRMQLNAETRPASGRYFPLPTSSDQRGEFEDVIGIDYQSRYITAAGELGLYVGMRGPSGTIFEGGIILLIAAMKADGSPAIRVVTPLCHPYIFNPIGKSLEDIHNTSAEGQRPPPPWGSVFRYPPHPPATNDSGGNHPLLNLLDTLHTLLAGEEHWTSLQLGSLKPSLPTWSRWDDQPEEEKRVAEAFARVYLKGRWSTECHHVCDEAFKKEVRLWLLVCLRVRSEGGVELPHEMQQAVIQRLSLMHHPVVTIDSVTGSLRGIYEVMQVYRQYFTSLDEPNNH